MMMSPHPFVETWRKWALEHDLTQPPYLLDDDREKLGGNVRPIRGLARRLYSVVGSWPEYRDQPDFGEPGDSLLQGGLLPMPFVGDVQSASIFLLQLNPGLGPHDYFGEYCVPEYRQTVLDNLSTSGKQHQFYFLDPKHSWHGGFDYWHSKLQATIGSLVPQCKATYGAVRRWMQKALCVIELVPYHSNEFKLPHRLYKLHGDETLHSVRLARSFVRDNLVDRANRGEVLILVMRKAEEWGFPDKQANHVGTVIYRGSECRSAHLSPDSPGGRAIVSFVRERFESEN